MRYLNRGPAKGLVRISARLVSVGSFAMRRILAAMLSRTLWYETALCFFLSIDIGTVAFITTLWLSQNRFAGPRRGIPKLRRLALSPMVA